MAVLTRAERKKIASPWVREVIRDKRESRNLTVTDILPAVQATEDWIEANNPSPPTGRTWGQVRRAQDRPLSPTQWSDYTSTLPQPFRGNTSASAKARLFVHTVNRAGLL